MVTNVKIQNKQFPQDYENKVKALWMDEEMNVYDQDNNYLGKGNYVNGTLEIKRNGERRAQNN